MKSTLQEIGKKTFLFYKIHRQFKIETDIAFKSYLAMVLEKLSNEIRVLTRTLQTVEGNEKILEEYLEQTCLTEKRKQDENL